MLRPMQQTCGNFLTTVGLTATVDDAVATCPALAPAAPDLPGSCASYSEFTVFSGLVTDACCTTGVRCPPTGRHSSYILRTF